MRVIPEAHANAISPEARAGEEVTPAHYLVDKTNFKYLPPIRFMNSC
jgi:hypothetical protein